MNTIKLWSKSLLLITLVSVLFVRCDDDDDTTDIETTGAVSMEITDAPIDDPNVQSVFVTVAEVKIDGETFDGFSGKQTIDILAYQNGQTEALGLGEAEVGTYNEISLVLDYESDANGASPGCYVLTADNTKHSLAANGMTEQEITIQSNDFEVQETNQTNLVVDFDLRKAIQYNEGGDESDYVFVAESDLETSLRFVEKEEAGMVAGNCSDDVSESDVIVAYAYAEGSYNESTETSGKVLFQNAVTSAKVNAQGNYTLAFLEEGDYEIVFAGYEDNDQDGQLELKGMLELNSILGINLNQVTVDANAQVSLDVVVTGLIP